jgi:DNA-binding MarR family transcriptional regulator
MTPGDANSHHTSGSRQVERSRASTEEPDARIAWHNLLQVSTRVIREFDRRLDREHRISAREFDVLINLDNAPDRRLRMTELANAAMLSSGGLTRLVGRLEERGYVRREQDIVDARAFHAKLTDTGRALLAEARVTHDAVIDDLFGAHLSAIEVHAMTRALARVLGPDRRT